MAIRMGPAQPRLLMIGNRREDRRRADFWRRQQHHGWPILNRTPERELLADLRARKRLLDEVIVLQRELDWEHTAKRLRRVGVRV